jgi:two-component system, NarL family, sensor kinase
MRPFIPIFLYLLTLTVPFHYATGSDTTLTQSQELSLAEQIRLKGLEFANEGNLEKAFYFYREALTLFEQDTDSIGLAKTYNNLGLLYRDKGQKVESLSAFYKAVAINVALKNYGSLALNYQNLANHFFNEGQYDKALEYYRACFRIFQQMNNVKQFGRISTSIGNLYSADSNEFYRPDSALYYYQLASITAEKIADEENFSLLYNNLAILYKKLDDLNQSLYYHRQSLKSKKKLNDARGQMNTLYNIGNLYLQQKAYDSSLFYYEQAKLLAEKRNDKRLYLDIINNMIKAEVALGNAAKIEPLFEQYNQLRDSLFNEESMQQLRTMETLFETDRIGKSLEQQKLITEKTRKQNRLLMGLSLIVSLMVVISAVLFYQRQKYLKRLRKEELAALRAEQDLRELNAVMHAQDQERHRIASDLHDRLGAKLSLLKHKLPSGVDASLSNELLLDLEQAIIETRAISHNLAANVLVSFGLPNGVEDILKDVQKASSIKTELLQLGDTYRMPLQVERNIYYIILELVNNTLKYAEASAITIQLFFTKEEFSFTYDDDGKGVDLESLQQKGMGLRNIHARASSIHASLHLGSRPGKGFHARLDLNLDTIEQ